MEQILTGHEQYGIDTKQPVLLQHGFRFAKENLSFLSRVRSARLLSFFCSQEELTFRKALTAAANSDMPDPVQNRDLHPGDTSGTKKRLMMAARR